MVTYASRKKEASAVSGGIVGQADFDAVTRKFMAVSGSDDTVTLKPGIGDLTADILVGATHNHTILGRIVFVLVLNNKAFTGIVVGFALTTPAELDLEPLEVGLALDDFHERLQKDFNV